MIIHRHVCFLLLYVFIWKVKSLDSSIPWGLDWFSLPNYESKSCSDYFFTSETNFLPLSFCCMNPLRVHNGFFWLHSQLRAIEDQVSPRLQVSWTAGVQRRRTITGAEYLFYRFLGGYIPIVYTLYTLIYICKMICGSKNQ